MRLIDADALIESLSKNCPEDPMTEAIVEIFKACVDSEPTIEAESQTGKWLEKEVLHKSEAETVIEEWQSCKCSVCGRYDTRPYLYYFDEPHFCSWCGARMVKEGEEHD